MLIVSVMPYVPVSVKNCEIRPDNSEFFLHFISQDDLQQHKKTVFLFFTTDSIMFSFSAKRKVM